MSTYLSVEISPATTTSPVVISVSQATRPDGSSLRTASRTESETWSAILSGWPSVTDSEVKRNSRAIWRGRLPERRDDRRQLLDLEEQPDAQLVLPRNRVLDCRSKRLQVPADRLRELRSGQLLDEACAGADVHVEEAVRLRRHVRRVERLLERRRVGERLAGTLHCGDPVRKIGDDEPVAEVGVLDDEVAEAEWLAAAPAMVRWLGSTPSCFR